jgi:ATP-dependent DNA helicase DinG
MTDGTATPATPIKVRPVGTSDDGFGEDAAFRDAVGAVFGPHGALAQANSEYRLRDAQVDMAQAVAQAIDANEALVVEAGTGVGKTFAYLVPVLLSGRRALISTATKSLQDQLFMRDLPRVRAALNVPVRTALLKGRDSYLCLHRLKQSRAGDDQAVSSTLRTLARIERWSHTTTTGDLSEVDGLDDRSPVLPSVTSTRDNCLGSQCPDFQGCHVVRARREAMAADVVVVNHHLFFADLTLRDTGVAELLPTVDIAVFDEAHHLVDTGVQFLGVTLSTAQVLDVARDLLASGLQLARGLMPWPDLAADLDRAARNLRLSVGGDRAHQGGAVGSAGPAAIGSTRSPWPSAHAVPAFHEALDRLVQACAEALSATQTCGELDPSFALLTQRLMQAKDRASQLREDCADANVRWLDVSTHHVRLVESPLDIADALRDQRAKAPKTWVFTSATLGDNDALTWFTDPTGLGDARTLKLGSPYDHAGNARLWLCADAPKPEDASHAQYVALVAARCAEALQGRTIVLTTTLRALSRIADALRQALQERAAPITVVMQGDQPKRVLLDRLRDQPGTVLVASQSFWEGIDVPGDALQCVIIDKLPFPPPNDPLIQARARRIEAEGGSAFNQCFLAEAAVSLKQGAGRLIRSESDRGLLVVCDPRMATMPYGKRLVRALPPMTKLTSWPEAQIWLASIAVDSPAW